MSTRVPDYRIIIKTALQAFFLISKAEITSIIAENYFNNIDTFNGNLLRSEPNDYEKWGSWTYYKRDDIHIGDMTNWTISTLAGALTGAFGIFSGPLTGLATLIYHKKYENIYANIYISTNVYCSILVKEKYNFYNSSSNAFIKTEKQAPSWWGSPWDYSQPAACRILAEKY